MSLETTWVFLRGWARESGHWRDFPKQFEQHFGARVFCLDLPGCGKFRDEVSPTSTRQVVEHVRSKVQAEVGDKPVSVLALSFGAMVAVDWAYRYPEQLQRLVLVNTSMGFNRFYERLSPTTYPKILPLFFQRDPVERERTILGITSGRDWSDEFVREHAEILKAHPIAPKNAIRQLLAAARFLPKRQAPKVPILLLNSLGDRLAHPRCSAKLASLWKLPLERHAWAGHDLVLDDPAWVLETVHRWAGA